MYSLKYLCKHFEVKRGKRQFSSEMLNVMSYLHDNKILPKKLCIWLQEHYQDFDEIDGIENVFYNYHMNRLGKNRFEQLNDYGIELNNYVIYPLELYDIIKDILDNVKSDDDLLAWFSNYYLDNNDEEYDVEIIAIHNKVHEIWANDLFELFLTEDGDLWDLVNASSHFRKANLSENAIEKLNANRKYADQQDDKSRSAYYVTLGGATRDIGERDKALKYAKLGYKLSPNNYRPCTLLGALYMEGFNVEEGHKWYSLAEKLGANVHGVNNEIIQILSNLSRKEKLDMINRLLSMDRQRYSYLKSKYRNIFK